MALSNYTELKASITRAIERSDMADDIDDWILLRESELNLLLHRREMSQRATTTTVIDQATYPLPSDFGDAISLHCADPDRQWKLHPSDWDYIATELSDSGQPREWSITSNEFLLGPVPDDEYTLELYYYKAIPPLGAVNATNWLLAGYPQLYYFGVLATASAVVSSPLAQNWNAQYQNALAIFKKDQIKERGFGGGPILRTEIFGGAPVNIITGE